MSRLLNCFLLCLVPILAGTLADSAAFADDTFTATNPDTAQTESVWAGVASGKPREIRFSIHGDSGWAAAEQITSDSFEDHEPCLVFTPSGDRRVFWWTDSSPDAIWYSEKAASGGAWSAPGVVTQGTDDARAPRAAVYSGLLFVAWEAVPENGNRRIVVQKQESPSPWPELFTWTASQSAPLDAQIHQSGSHLWIDWMDSASVVRWTEYSGGAWGSAQPEGYSGASDLEAARLRVRDHVTGR